MSSENRTNIPNSLNEHWMPFTSNKDFKKSPRLITEAKGVYLKTHHGKTQIDASSGLFCNPLGHGRKEITEAVTKQLETLGKVDAFKNSVTSNMGEYSKMIEKQPTILAVAAQCLIIFCYLESLMLGFRAVFLKWWIITPTIST